MPARRKPIEAQWQGFAKAVLPAGIGNHQRTEMQKSFYAGAHSLFRLLMDEVGDDQVDPTQVDLDIMSDVEEDIRDFVAKMEGG